MTSTISNKENHSDVKAQVAKKVAHKGCRCFVSFEITIQHHTWRKLQKYNTACLNIIKLIQLCNIIYINYISRHREIPSISFMSRQHSVTLSPAKSKSYWSAIYSVAVILMGKNMTALNITRLKRKEYQTDYPIYGHVHQPEEKKR